VRLHAGPVVSNKGPRLSLTPQQQKEARQRRAQGATLAELARSYGVGKARLHG
jgi:hypothetical protein